MDLTFLVIANSIMRTRLPPKKAQGQDGRSAVKSVLTDLPFIICVVGAFLVRIRPLPISGYIEVDMSFGSAILGCIRSM